MLERLRYHLSELLFSSELDEAFQMGLKEGKRQQAAELRVRLEYKKTRAAELGMTKTQTIGYERCMEVVADVIN